MLDSAASTDSGVRPTRLAWPLPAGWRPALLGLLVLLSGLAGGLTWSYRQAPPFVLDVGSKDARPYLQGFHEPEQTPDGLTFRWTRASAVVTIPGFGRRDAQLTLALAGAGRGAAPLPEMTLLVDGQELARLPLTAAVQRYTVTIPASAMPGGDVIVELRSSEFQPPNDRRRLGILVDAVSLLAADGSPPALPPWRLLLLAGLIVGLTALVGWRCLGYTSGLVLAGSLGAGVIAISQFDRYVLLPWLGDGAPLVVVASLLVLIAQPVAVRRLDLTPAVAGRLCLILWCVALAHLLGVAHPQFLSSDLTMNVHRLEDVGRGQWLFTLALPGKSALPAPYPPAFYALMLPLLPLVDHSAALKEALVTHTGALLLTLLAAAAFLLGTRLGGTAVGLWAALLHGLAPTGFLLVSQGNFANIFGQAVAGLVLVLLIARPDWRSPLTALVITGAMVVALLGHFGVFLTLLPTLPLLALARLDGQAAGRRQALTLLALFGLALAIVFALYYRHYLGLIGEILQRIAAARTAEPTEALGWRSGLAAEWRRTEQALGWLALPLALAGLPGLWRPPSVTGRLIAGWLAAAALFGLVGLLLGLTVRYHFFALLGLAVTGGWALAWLGRRGWPGRLAAGLLAGSWIVGSLLFWYDRIIKYLH